ncbi:MAG: IS66 family transposase [Gallintestinimicrobium sp.]
MTVEEMNTQLQMQVNALNASLNSLQQSFDAQTALITQLNQTIQELREQLNKNSKNSSKPPSSDGFKKPAPKSLRKPSGKKVGGQEGHQGTYLSVISDPDEIVKHMPSACEGCPHYKMCKGTACVAEKRHVIDAVVTVNVVEHQLLEIPICMLHGDTRKGSFPNDVKATVQYGENLQALSVALNTVGAVSVKRTHEILSGVFNIPLATGIISNMVKRCADAVSETVNRIKQKVADSSLGHFDETGTRVDKKLWWVHDASNCEFTYLDISPKRGYLGMEQCGVLPLFHGISMHDCWASYWSYEDCQHAVCCAHLLRELTGIAENHPEQKWASAFIGLLIKMKKVKDKAVEAGKETLSYYHYHKFDKRYDELIKQAREKKSASGYRREKTWEKEKKERFLLWWSALIITRHQSAFLSITSWFRLITIRRNEI